MVPVIGLVGGIGSGKSFLAQWLQKNRQTALVEGDAAGHEVLKDEGVKQQLHQVFGPEVFTPEGEIDRPRMSARVFGAAPEQQSTRAALETIVHPRITEKLKQQIAAAKADANNRAVVLDAALLLEAGWRSLCDHVVYVDAPEEQRQERVRDSRGWSAAQLRAREESQFSLEQKRKEAHDVVDNSQGVEHAVSQMDAIFSRITRPIR